LDYLQDQIKRIKQVDEYYKKMVAQKKDKKRDYYLEGMKMLLVQDETIENYQEILEEYETAYIVRKANIDNLFSEIKNIKRIRKEI
jgi:hypothetical protein